MIHTPSHYFTDHEKPLVIAHRGGRGLWPENTLLAFRNAVKMGVDALEFDVQRTKDGVFVVIHDGTVDRTTNGSGNVAELTLEQIKQLDAGYRWSRDGTEFPFRGIGVTIPTLEEVLDEFRDIKLNIEVKERDPDAANALCKLVEKYNAQDRLMVGSFYTRIVMRTREICPSIATSAGRAEIKKFYIFHLFGLGRFYALPVHALEVPEFSGDVRIVSKRFVKAASHRKSLPVYVWTVNETDAMRRLLRFGVRGLISDYPDRAKQVVDEFYQNTGIQHG